MANLNDVRDIATALPETHEKIDGARGGITWRTKNGAFAWEREPSKTDHAALAALGREWPSGTIIGIRTDGEHAKEALLQAHPDAFFSIPHFDGFPAVLVRLDTIDPELLREVIIESWLLKAPKTLARQWLAQHGLPPENPDTGEA